MTGEGFNLGNAYGAVIIDVSGVNGAMQQARQAIDSGLAGVGDRISSIGDTFNKLGNSLKSIGANMAAIGAPVAAGFVAATRQAMDFDESITNIAAVLNLTQDEASSLGKELKGMGASSRAGAQEVAQAFYDIAGGVADASTHMAILEQSIATSEAGNSSLAGTTNALISVMNSYNLTAEQASMVSDVLTRTVGMGVGTMDQFAAAFPSVTGVANSLGISFENLGQMMAYLTTKGNSTSEAATQLSSLMVAMLKPNNEMTAALNELGFASGEAAVQQLGLVGAYNAIGKTQKAVEKGMGTLIGRVEGIRAVTSFGSKDVESFFKQFTSGVKGATAAAREIQNQSMAAKWDILNSRIQDVAITIGNTLFPVLSDLMEQLTPIVYSISEWIEQNPELVKQIALIAGALVIVGPIIAAIGLAISTVGSIISGIGAVIGVIMSPIGLLIAAGAAIVYLFRDQISGFISSFIEGLKEGVNPIEAFAAAILDGFGSNGITLWIANAILTVKKFFDNFQLYGSLIKLYAEYYFQAIVIAIQPVIDKLVEIWTTVKPKFDDLQKTFGEAADAAKKLVEIGLLVLLDTLNKAAVAAKELIDIGLIVLVDTLNKASISAGLLWSMLEFVLINALNNASLAAQDMVKSVSDWIEKNRDLLTHLGNLGLSLMLAIGVLKLYELAVTAAAVASGLGTGLAGAIAAAKAAALASISGFLAAAIPVVALTAAIWAAIEAYQKFQEVTSYLAKGANDVAGATAAAITNNGLTHEQFMAKAFNAAVSQMGDLGARIWWDQGGGRILSDAIWNQGVTQAYAPSRDGGGPGFAMQPYMIGNSQLKNEVYIPGADGQFVSGFVDLMKQVAAGVGGGQGSAPTVNVMMPEAALANPSAAKAMGQDFGRAIADEMRVQGVRPLR